MSDEVNDPERMSEQIIEDYKYNTKILFGKAV